MNSQDLLTDDTMSGKISSRKRTKVSERSGTLSGDPFRGRRPTSHERMTGLPIRGYTLSLQAQPTLVVSGTLIGGFHSTLAQMGYQTVARSGLPSPELPA
jgi:hypothetical protein